MKLLSANIFGSALLMLLSNGCSTDWVWTPGPVSSHDIAGSVFIEDSTGHQLQMDDRSAIKIELIQYGYPWTVLDSAITDANGRWAMPNAPIGDMELVAHKSGYSIFSEELHRQGKFDDSVIDGEIASTMHHPVVLDSVAIKINGTDSSLTVYGHDPNHSGTVLLCLDSAGNIPVTGLHLATNVSQTFGIVARGSAGAFIGWLPLAPHDSLSIVAYAINPMEAQREEQTEWSTQYAGYRTGGPGSNTIIISH